MTLAQAVGTEEAFGYGTSFLGYVEFYIVYPLFFLLGKVRFEPVEYPGGIRTTCYTETATNTTVVIDKNDAILAFESCIYWAYLGTGRIITMVAGLRHVIGCSILCILHLEYVDVMLFRTQLMRTLTGSHAFPGVLAS